MKTGRRRAQSGGAAEGNPDAKLGVEQCAAKERGTTALGAQAGRSASSRIVPRETIANGWVLVDAGAARCGW